MPGFLPLSLLLHGVALAGTPSSPGDPAAVPPAPARASTAPGATTAAAYRAPPPASPGISLDLETAAHCARSSALLGGACSFQTGMTARRVIEEGLPWTWAGALAPRLSEGDLAAPYLADEATRVLATELLERLSATPRLTGTNLFIGRSLEIDGVTYVVLTAFAPVDT